MTTENNTEVQPEGTQEGAPEAIVPNNPLTPNAGKQEVPVNPIQEELVKPKHPQQEAPKEEPKEAPKYNDKTSFVQGSIQYLGSEIGFSEDEFDAVLESAIKHGDASLINPSALGKDLDETQVARIKQVAELAYQEHTQTVQRAQEEVHTVAGGKEAWDNHVQAFNANATEDVKNYTSWLLDNGKLKEAAEYVIKQNTAGGYVNKTTTPAVQGGNGSPSNGAMTASEFKVAVGKLTLEAGNRSLSSGEQAQKLQDLHARRALGRQQGL